MIFGKKWAVTISISDRERFDFGASVYLFWSIKQAKKFMKTSIEKRLSLFKHDLNLSEYKAYISDDEMYGYVGNSLENDFTDYHICKISKPRRP